MSRFREILAWLPPRTERHRLALLWAVITVAVAAATAPPVGISRDESVYLWAGESYVAWWGKLVHSPAQAFGELGSDDGRRFYGVNHEHPGLAKLLYGATHALLGPDEAGAGGVTNNLEAIRFGAFLFAGLLSCLLAFAGWDLAGRGGALLAPALFWLVPRHFYHGHPAVLDLPITALWFATAYAYWKSLAARRPGQRLRRAAVVGLLFGAAVSVKHNGWFLPAVFLLHLVLTRAPALFRRRPGGGPAIPLAFPAMAVLGPLVFLATWPWLWRHGLGRIQGYFAFHLQHENYPWMYLGTLLRDPPFPVGYPLVVTALTVPAGVLAAYAGGALHGLSRLVRGFGSDSPEGAAGDELFWLMNAAFSIALITMPSVPHFGGVKHWMPSMPFLALLGARAMVSAGRALWPERATAVTFTLGFFALTPALVAVAHIHPFGTAAYNELAGGAAGAAGLGMQRQFWGDNMAAALESVNAHAIRGARVWYQEATWLAARAYQRDGLLRTDLRWADDAAGAEISVYHYHQEFRDKEFTTWTEFGTAHPVAGVYLDEVPLIEIYARPGAWQ